VRWRATEAGAVCGLLLAALAWGFPARPSRSDPRAARSSRDIPPLIFTAAPVYQSLSALNGRDRFPRGARLMILRQGEMQPLVPEFAATADPSVSFDAKTVLFSGKKNASDPWQIWRMPIDGRAPRLVLGGNVDLIRPQWMPDDRFVYARREQDGFALETARLDGSGVLRLTYLPGNFIPDDVLRDGRVLFESNFPLAAEATLQPAARMPAGSDTEMFLVYADGSGVESVRCDHPDGMDHAGREHGRQISLNSKVADAGDIVFTERGRLARFTSALSHEAPVVAPPAEYAGDIAELTDGRWILSARKTGSQHFAILAWTPGSASLTEIAHDAARDLIEPVVVASRDIPNRHPSALHPWTYANLLVLDARQSRGGDLATAPARVRAETLSTDGHPVSLGTAPVEKDGSFYVQVAGDRPLRFILLDAAGHPLRAEHGWFWARRGEQRVCVGCHTGPERSPENRVPLVLLHTTTSVDLTGGAAAPAPAGGR
jgi:hypothetical protein